MLFVVTYEQLVEVQHYVWETVLGIAVTFPNKRISSWKNNVSKSDEGDKSSIAFWCNIIKQQKNCYEFLSTLCTNVPKGDSRLSKERCQNPASLSITEAKYAYRSSAGMSRCWHPKKREHVILASLPGRGSHFPLSSNAVINSLYNTIAVIAMSTCSGTWRLRDIDWSKLVSFLTVTTVT